MTHPMEHKHPLGTFTKSFYKIETTWPGNAAPKFASYYAHAYTLDDNPGARHEDLAVMRRSDLFDKRIGGRGAEKLHFLDAESAHAVAKLLREHGRVAAGWEGPETWREDYRGAIDACVVFEVTTTHREIVNAP